MRILRIGAGSVMKAVSRMSPPQPGHTSGNGSTILAMSCAHAMRAVSWERGGASGAPLYDKHIWKAHVRFRE